LKKGEKKKEGPTRGGGYVPDPFVGPPPGQHGVFSLFRTSKRLELQTTKRKAGKKNVETMKLTKRVQIAS